MTQRTVDQALQKFGGTRAHGKALCVVRSDAASEVTESVKYLGWLPAPGIANDPLHNPKLERLIRSIKEGTRAIHLKARLSPRFMAAVHRILLCCKINFATSACESA